jgi:hypothetical protein
LHKAIRGQKIRIADASAASDFRHADQPLGKLVLQLHRFVIEHHHSRIGDPSSRPYGNGVALWFEIDDFDDAVERAARLRAEVVLPPHRNPPDGPGGPRPSRALGA